MGESSKHAIERPGRGTNFREVTLLGSGVIISLVQEAAAYAPCAELKQAAAVALVIIETIQAVKDNKEAYKRLGDDSAALIVAIWRSYKKAESSREWLSADMQEILVELTHTLDHICSFVREKLARSKAMRVIYSRADVGKIAEYRENLNYAMQKFELQSHLNIDLKLGKLSEQIKYRNGEDMKRILEISAREARETESIHEQELKAVKKSSTFEHLKQLEIDHHQAEDEREHSEELKKRKKGKERQSELERLRAAARASTLEHRKQLEIDHQAEDEREYSEELREREKDKDRQSELERLRAAARALEMANRLKKAEEEEIVELRRMIAANRRNTVPQAQPSKSSTEEDEFEDEKNSRRKEEDQLGRKTNSRRSPRGPLRATETFTDDDEESLRRSNLRTARRKLSSTPPQLEETESESTDDEKPPPPKKGPKVTRKPQIPPGSPPREVDDLMAQFQGFRTPLGGSPHGSRSSSPMFYPPYGSPLPPSTPNGYGYGYMLGSVVNTGVGNITNSIISNVGNDNSVQKVYRTPRNRRT